MKSALAILFLVVGPPLAADPSFWDHTLGLIQEEKWSEADAAVQAVLAENPKDVDALVLAGTVVLYSRLEQRRDDSIFRPEVDVAGNEPRLPPEAADAVASYWKQVPALDPSKAWLWGDLAEMTFRSGDSIRAVDYAILAAKETNDPEALRKAASVLALNLEWAKAAQALAKIPGERLGFLYQGLDAWRTGKDGWRGLLKAFVDNPDPLKTGVALAGYLLGPSMRDGEAGFLAALQVDSGIPSLIVRQKYVERYPDKFQPRLELARCLCQFGSFGKALVHFAEIDRKGVASTPEQRQAVLFQQAWAHQAAGHRAEADRGWTLLVDSRDFYLRGAAAWFLGQEAQRQGNLDAAKERWALVADEPARSKYAFWCAQALAQVSGGETP